jgi:hypothetical protein
MLGMNPDHMSLRDTIKEAVARVCWNLKHATIIKFDNTLNSAKKLWMKLYVRKQLSFRHQVEAPTDRGSLRNKKILASRFRSNIKSLHKTIPTS